MDLIGLSLLIGATAYRIWRLIAVDSSTGGLRLKLIKPGGWVDSLVSCSWCLGTWITLAIAIPVVLLTDVPYPWLVVGTSPVVTGTLGYLLPE